MWMPIKIAMESCCQGLVVLALISPLCPNGSSVQPPGGSGEAWSAALRLRPCEMSCAVRTCCGAGVTGGQPRTRPRLLDAGDEVGGTMWQEWVGAKQLQKLSARIIEQLSVLFYFFYFLILSAMRTPQEDICVPFAVSTTVWTQRGGSFI